MSERLAGSCRRAGKEIEGFGCRCRLRGRCRCLAAVGGVEWEFGCVCRCQVSRVSRAVPTTKKQRRPLQELAGGRKNRLTNVAGLLWLGVAAADGRLVTTRSQPGYACEAIAGGRAVQTIGIGGLMVDCRRWCSCQQLLLAVRSMRSGKALHEAYTNPNSTPGTAKQRPKQCARPTRRTVARRSST